MDGLIITLDCLLHFYYCEIDSDGDVCANIDGDNGVDDDGDINCDVDGDADGDADGDDDGDAGDVDGQAIIVEFIRRESSFHKSPSLPDMLVHSRMNIDLNLQVDILGG